MNPKPFAFQASVKIYSPFRFLMYHIKKEIFELNGMIYTLLWNARDSGFNSWFGLKFFSFNINFYGHEVNSQLAVYSSQ
jgi:hypothetical protein